MTLFPMGLALIAREGTGRMGNATHALQQQSSENLAGQTPPTAACFVRARFIILLAREYH